VDTCGRSFIVARSCQSTRLSLTIDTSLIFLQINNFSGEIPMEGIKNSREMLELVAVLAEALKEAKADGKINVFDLPKLAPVIPALRSAVEKSELIPAELKDLDKDELTELLTLTVDAVMKLLDAVFKVHAA
jgi:hypothetical protein